MIYDNHGRIISYLRLAVTDRCNLRCLYCMPSSGLNWTERKELMSFEEMLFTCRLLASHGINKIRITGGEPFLRNDLIKFIASLVKVKGINEVTITTNGVLAAPFIPELHAMGVRAVNLSLDTLDRDRFMEITRRDELPAVLNTLDALLRHGMEVKINAVVMRDKNIEDIIPLIEMSRNLPVAIRFIEEMPFNGEGHSFSGNEWDHVMILSHIKEYYPDIEKMPDPLFSTSYNYRIPGHKGSVGIIAAYSRSFCGTCNRIRITPQGDLKTCLYGANVLNIKDLLRNGATSAMIEKSLFNAFNNRAATGWEAEDKKTKVVHPSMAEIGG